MIHMILGTDPRNNNQPLISVYLMENQPDNKQADFIAHLRDFLIQMKQMRGEDTTDLFLEERMAELKAKQEDNRRQEAAKNAAIPGMVNPYAALNDDETLQ